MQIESWVISIKNGVQTNSVRRYDNSFYEVEREETVFFLMEDGSFRKAKRTLTEIGWSRGSGLEVEKMNWSDWEIQSMTDIDDLLMEFDFEGSYSADDPGFWGRRSGAIGDMASYLDTEVDLKWNLRQIYPKGVGLYLALKRL